MNMTATSSELSAVKEASGKLSGSGNVSAYGLKTETCAAAISGSGDIEVSVSNSIEVEYHGNARLPN